MAKLKLRGRLWAVLAVLVVMVASWPTCANEAALVEYLQRLRVTDLQNPVDVMDLADWAQRRNLTDKAAEHYRGVLTLEPEHPYAYDQLVKIADTGRLVQDEDREAELLRHFGDPFELRVSPHFLIVYDTDKKWAVNRAILLEKTHDLYYKSMRNAGLRPLPLAERLVCVLFDDHAVFQKYGQVIDELKIDWSSGYYSSRTNRIAFFNDKSSPVFAETTKRIHSLEGSTEELKTQLKDPKVFRNGALAAETRRQLQEQQRDLNWHRNRLDAIAAMNNASKTTHEALHQLAFNSRLLRRGEPYPFWLVEGMATNYEVEDPAKGFGPYYINEARRQQLIEQDMAQRLIDLPDFVSMVRPPSEGGETVAVMYAQGWGLFQFLFKKRHTQMVDYLRRLGATDRTELDEESLRQEFEDTFGDLKRLDREWQAYLRLMRP